MTLQAISSAATVALAGTVVILLAVKSWRLISLPFGGSTLFSGSIMVEAAQRFRDELDKLKSEQALYMTLTAMFVVMFAIAYVLRPEDTLGALPYWKNVIVLVAIGVATLYGIYRFAVIVRRRRWIAFVRDANIAVGHSLQKLTATQARVFHDVATPTGVIDNVVVSLQGVYAVCVVPRRPPKNNRVRLEGDQLSFAPGNTIISLNDFQVHAKQLGKLLMRQSGHPVRVRPVIAVPGWEIDSQASDTFLAVNERNVAMLSGWKNENDYLLNEDVDAIVKYLTNCNTQKSRS